MRAVKFTAILVLAVKTFLSTVRVAILGTRAWNYLGLSSGQIALVPDTSNSTFHRQSFNAQ
jgi:hypothetical protein